MPGGEADRVIVGVFIVDFRIEEIGQRAGPHGDRKR
jgi:hypothetical protein